jgi:hypothetical protein
MAASVQSRAGFLRCVDGTLLVVEEHHTNFASLWK